MKTITKNATMTTLAELLTVAETWKDGANVRERVGTLAARVTTDGNSEINKNANQVRPDMRGWKVRDAAGRLAALANGDRAETGRFWLAVEWKLADLREHCPEHSADADRAA